MKNVLNLFYNVVHYADSTFSHKLKDEFFKDAVLKHSKERILKKGKKKAITATITKGNKEADNDLNNIGVEMINANTSVLIESQKNIEGVCFEEFTISNSISI